MAPEEDISREERKRYARQFLIKGWDQKALNEATVFIAGVGALGCEIAKDLALCGVGKLLLCDLDTIETSNLSRQLLFRPGDEGRPKAEVAAERLKEMNPFIQTESYFKKLQDIPIDVYEGCDAIIAALDNIKARMDLNDLCIRLKKPMIEGGTVGFEGHVQVIIPEGTPVTYGNKDTVIDGLIEEEMFNLCEDDHPEYFSAQKRIEELEEEIDRLKDTWINPVKEQVKETVIAQWDEEKEKKYLNNTACYRCVVPVMPADRGLVAACTLKGIPLTREHCVLRAEMTFSKNHGDKKPDFESDEEVYELMNVAQQELEGLRERVFNENFTEEQIAEMSEEEQQNARERIKQTFGPDYTSDEMENILGNKIPAVQTVSSVISSIESQEALKLVFRMHGRDVGDPMFPPYINYNGIFGQFDHVPVSRRDDCVACGSGKGQENMEIVIPADNATVNDLFVAMAKAKSQLDEEKWLVTVVTNGDILWDPRNDQLRNLDYQLSESGVVNGSEIRFTPIPDAADEEKKISQYNVFVRLL
ncbi:MAG TPA: ThiF family adenylyltransferase [Candidatus Lokiarchaeia archaeon]|nr:ThiF family adenylyltransferase [Candidatus Lokiarchaeia archaeon]